MTMVVRPKNWCHLEASLTESIIIINDRLDVKKMKFLPQKTIVTLLVARRAFKDVEI